jgi:hypothetical protein
MLRRLRGAFEILGVETLFETIGFPPMQVRISAVSQKYERSRGLIKMLMNLLGFSDQSERLIGLKRY